MRTFLSLCVVSLLVIGCGKKNNGQSGADGSFGSNGLVRVDFGAGRADDALGVAAGANGRVYVVGRSALAGQTDFAIARLDEGGKLDSGFGNNGKLLFDFHTDADEARAVLPLASGGAWIIGNAVNAAFGAGIGMVRVSNAGVHEAHATLPPAPGGAYQVVDALPNSDGTFFVGGSVREGGRGYFFLRKFNTAGTADATFNARIAIGTTDDVAYGFFRDRSSRMVLYGIGTNNTSSEVIAIRFAADGSRDLAFGGGGVARLSPVNVGLDPANGRAGAVAVGPGVNGELGIASSFFDGVRSVGRYARWTESGILTDTAKPYTFDDGVFLPRGLTIAGSGVPLAFGIFQGTVGAPSFAVLRFSGVGDIDKGFGTKGRTLPSFGGSRSDAKYATFDRSGRVLAAGSAVNAAGTKVEFAVMRYRP